MAGSLTIDTNAGKVATRLEKLAIKSGVPVGFIVNDQMRLWINDIMRKGQPQTLKEGRARIAADVSRLFTSIDNPIAVQSWKQQAITRGGDIFTTTRAGRMRISQKQLKVESLSQMRAIHDANRTTRGGVRKRPDMTAWGGEGIVPRPLFRAFLRETQARVGILKARFGKAALHYAGITGGGTPAYKAWIKRHIPGGGFSGKIDKFGNGAIVATNDARYAAQQFLSQSWWSATKAKRQADLIRGGFKRMADLTKRFNAAGGA